MDKRVKNQYGQIVSEEAAEYLMSLNEKEGTEPSIYFHNLSLAARSVYKAQNRPLSLKEVKLIVSYCDEQGVAAQVKCIDFEHRIGSYVLNCVEQGWQLLDLLRSNKSILPYVTQEVPITSQ